MSKVLSRSQKYVFSKNEIVKAMGVKWGLDNGYMDADSHDDIYHLGVDKSQLSDFKGTNLEILAKVFPCEVLRVIEDLERNSLASNLTQKWHKELKEALLKIEGNASYEGRASDGSIVVVSEVPYEISEAVVEVGKDSIEIVIKNPEHFVNGHLSEEGRFYPIEVFTDYPCPQKEIHNRILNAISFFHKEYGKDLDRVEFRLDSNYENKDLLEALKDLDEEVVVEVASEYLSNDKARGEAEKFTQDIKKALSLLEKEELIEAIVELALEKLQKVNDDINFLKEQIQKD